MYKHCSVGLDMVPHPRAPRLLGLAVTRTSLRGLTAPGQWSSSFRCIWTDAAVGEPWEVEVEDKTK